jgi:hypothetical protein
MRQMVSPLVVFAVLLSGCGAPPRAEWPIFEPEAAAVSEPGTLDELREMAERLEKRILNELERTTFFPVHRRRLMQALTPERDALTRMLARPPTGQEMAREPFSPVPGGAGLRGMGHALRWPIEDAVAERNVDRALDAFERSLRYGVRLLPADAVGGSLGWLQIDESRRAILPALRYMSANQLRRLSTITKAALAEIPPFSETVRRESANVRRAGRRIGEWLKDNNLKPLQENLGVDGLALTDYLNLSAPTPPERATYLAKFAAEMEAVLAHETEFSDRPALEAAATRPRFDDRRPWRRLHKHFLTTFELARVQRETSIARLRLLILAAELERRDRMRLPHPKSTAEFSAEAATDPFTGERFPFRYDGRLTPYSVGANLRDDGGDTNVNGTRPDLILDPVP